VADGPSTPTEVDWRSAVTVREDVPLAQLLRDRIAPESALRPVSVTDLIGPRRAFWRAIMPVKMDLVRQQRIDVGRAFHRRLGVALSTEGALEVRVRRDGVVGRIDLLGDVPVEVKTSSSTVASDQLTDARPDQVEQLAMYCAMADRPAGRLVTFVTGNAADHRVQAVDMAFDDPEAIRREMRTRRDALRTACINQSAGGLPPCRWFGRGCEFQEAGVCDCRAEDSVMTSPILREVSGVHERSDVAERIESRLRETPEPNGPPNLERFRDLLYPRRAYFERTSPEPTTELPRRNPVSSPDLYGRLTEAVESGPLGEVTRLPPRSDEPEEEVGGFRGAPYLVRTSRGRDRAGASTILENQPQYALELGLRCVATGTAKAYLFLGRERPGSGQNPVQVFEFQFAPASPFARLWRERARQVATALRERTPQSLLACPGWMYSGCPYRSDCACGGSGTRSQR
jgi:hypothetical protein